jgi:hypothetical protein
MIFSDAARYCAFVSSTQKMVKVFKVVPGNRRVASLYSIDGWYSTCFLSDDGQKFIHILWLTTQESVETVPVVKMWINGSLVKSLYLKEILGDAKPLKVSSGEYAWIKNTVGFSGDNGFTIELINGSTYEIKF